MAQVRVFEPSALDKRILGIVAQDEGIPLTALIESIFPDFTPVWVWERVRRLRITGHLQTVKAGNRLYLFTAAEGGHD